MIYLFKFIMIYLFICIFIVYILLNTILNIIYYKTDNLLNNCNYNYINDTYSCM